jgi:hypothetical protein
MSDMPKRDITGNCEGDCKDRVREGEFFSKCPRREFTE